MDLRTNEEERAQMAEMAQQAMQMEAEAEGEAEPPPE